MHDPRLGTLAEWVTDYFDNVYEHKDLVPDRYPEWKRYMKDIYAKSPYLREYLKSHCSWYRGLFKELSGEQCTHPDDGPPEAR